MANIIRAVVALFWLATTIFTGYLAYIVLQTEGNPQVLWAWLVMCAFTFLSATFLAYTVIFGARDNDDTPHQQNNLKAEE